MPSLVTKIDAETWAKSPVKGESSGLTLTAHTLEVVDNLLALRDRAGDLGRGLRPGFGIVARVPGDFQRHPDGCFHERRSGWVRAQSARRHVLSVRNFGGDYRPGERWRGTGQPVPPPPARVQQPLQRL